MSLLFNFLSWVFAAIIEYNWLGNLYQEKYIASGSGAGKSNVPRL